MTNTLIIRFFGNPLREFINDLDNLSIKIQWKIIDDNDCNYDVTFANQHDLNLVMISGLLEDRYDDGMYEYVKD